MPIHVPMNRYVLFFFFVRLVFFVVKFLSLLPRPESESSL
jgi:hypothetical protein